MSSKKLHSPNDSLQQSTREPSTRLGDRGSLDGTSYQSGSRFLGGGSTIGGGSYSSYMADHLSRMHNDIEATTRKLELEQRRLYKLDKDLKSADVEWAQKRQRYKLGQAAHDESVASKAAGGRKLERRLAKAIEDLNQNISNNEKLREQIDQLRKERLSLNRLFKSLQGGIASTSHSIEGLKTSISDSQAVCEESKQKSRALNKMLERERKSFNRGTEMLKKQMNLENEVQKEQEKIKHSEPGVKGVHNKSRRGFMVADEEEFFSDSLMHRRILKLSFLNTIQRRHIRQHRKNVEVFEQAFSTIRTSTGISDIEQIVNIFIMHEQRNFSLLTYVNTLQREIESIEIDKRNLQSQKDKHFEEEKLSEARKESTLSDVNAQIAKLQAGIVDKDRINDEVAAFCEDVRPIIWNMVTYLKEEIPNLLQVAYEGDVPAMKTSPPDKHEEALIPYLMYIEEALHQFRVCLSSDALAPRILQCATKSGAGGTLKTSDLPSAHTAGDDSDDDPETGLGDRPMTKSELRERAQAVIARRRKKPGQQSKHGEERRAEVTDPLESGSELRPRADTGYSTGGAPPPPPRGEYAASSVGSAGDTVVSAAGPGAASKSPNGSGAKNPEGAPKGAPEGTVQEEDPSGKAPYREAMWWRNEAPQGAKGKR